MEFALRKDAIFNNDRYIFIVLCTILFIFSPLIGCGAMCLFVFFTNDKQYAKVLLPFLALLIFVIQMTRSFSWYEPSDWPMYRIQYQHASTTPFLQYVFSEKEVVWNVVRYIGYYLTGGNFILYASIIVSLTFYFTGYSAYKYWGRTGCDVRYLVAALGFCFFFNEFLLISNNLLRQQFAMSLMTLVLVARYTEDRIRWILLLIAVNIHTMTLIFVPFLFLRSDKRLSAKYMLYVICFITFLYLVINVFSKSFAGSSIYALERLNRSTQTVYELDDIINPIVVIKFSAFVMVCYVKALYIDKMTNPYRNIIYNFIAIFCLFMIAIMNLPQVVTRIYICRFFFMPLFFPYIFLKQKSILTNCYLLAIFLFFYIRFLTMDSLFLNIPVNIFGNNVFSILSR